MKRALSTHISDSSPRTLDPQHRRRQTLADFLVTIALLGLVLLPALVPSQAAGEQGSREQQTDRRPAVRIGTYDSRAVAVAYVRSELSARQMKELKRQHGDAVKANDQKRIEQLNDQGEAMQIRLNLQGFSTAPIDDVLDTVRDRLPQVARQKDVIVITRIADHHDGSVELVDVTDELVALFGPNDQTLKIIRELRMQPPVAIEVAARMPASGG